MVEQSKEITRCPGENAHHFTTAGLQCVETCPAGYRKETKDIIIRKKDDKKVAVSFCTKDNLPVSEQALINRGIRKAAFGRNVLPSIFGEGNFKGLPETVIDRTGPRPRIRMYPDMDALAKATTIKERERIVSSTLPSNNFVACETLAYRLKNYGAIPKPTDRQVMGVFSSMANLQRKGTLTRDIMNACRDHAYCKIHQINGNEEKKKECECKLATDPGKIERCVNDGTVKKSDILKLKIPMFVG